MKPHFRALETGIPTLETTRSLNPLGSSLTINHTLRNISKNLEKQAKPPLAVSPAMLLMSEVSG
jgi:hypothetical protein